MHTVNISPPIKKKMVPLHFWDESRRFFPIQTCIFISRAWKTSPLKTCKKVSRTWIHYSRNISTRGGRV